MPQRIGDRIPELRPKTVKGYRRAYVTLRDALTKRAKDYDLGAWGSAESQRRYTALIDGWRGAGYRLPGETPCEEELIAPNLNGTGVNLAVNRA